MAKTVYRANTFKNPENGKPKLNRLGDFLLKDPRFQLAVGGFLIITSFALFIAFSSYFFTGVADQSLVEGGMSTDIQEDGATIQNWMGLTGAVLAHIFIFKWFGIAAFALIPIAFILGWRLAFKVEIFPILTALKLAGFTIFWTTLLLGTLFERDAGIGFWGGGLGYAFADILNNLFGRVGTILVVLFALMVFIIYFFQVPTTISTENSFLNSILKEFQNVKGRFNEFKPEGFDPTKKTTATKTATSKPTGKDELDILLEIDDNFEPIAEKAKNTTATAKDLGKTILPKDKKFTRPNPKLELEIDPNSDFDEEVELDDLGNIKFPKGKGIQTKINFDLTNEDELGDDFTKTKIDKAMIGTESFNPKKALHPDLTDDELERELKNILNPDQSDSDTEAENTTVADPMLAGLYDPTLELSRYVKPFAELLEETSTGKRQVTNEELEANKDKIVETLSNYGIGISQIKATIGPTVTLYEIIPEAGVRISKIKNLEDDIALSLAALGIRIIAPIPGKGTIGIEVPNKKREVVSMRSIIESDVFKNTEKILPVVLGKSITNEIVVADLAKMPHLLMAGATGQGKSVGLNVFLTSLIYKKHPAELKFVLVDPKKVELTLFNKIEKHFLAKLPNEEEAIITDTGKVVNTLLALGAEMDTRYNLMKEAACRNIQEYNTKFKHRRLNPKKGHRFLPYIVLVIDELADLMMVAGKEVEQPIARLAQLARAIGIHLIVATQRPSVNVITGIIKANFPARLSFKVTSKIDSRTILDAGGAEQLVGMGDFLFSMGSDMIRLQCPFIDTPEVERVCDYINEQQSYANAYELPEIETNDAAGFDDEGGDYERDVLFEEAARIIVMHQQGSTSLLQRRLKLGYNRAGRLIDQLEKAGIVGPFEGSKAREVLVPDEYSLERILSNLEK
jgi:S-DNA-T family DNA segregation ATPase FtsK/SpoIIIE